MLYFNYGEFLENNFILAAGIQIIKPIESCIHLSTIKIDNKDGQVEISKNDGNSLPFQKALMDYYEPNLTQLAEDVGNNRVCPTLEKFRAVINVGKAEIQRLKNSTILTVYAVIKGEDNKDSIIWGLARDNNNPDPETNRFHWITDLEEDISVLLK